MSRTYFGPQRNANEIVLYLSPKQPVPSAVPFELQEYVSADTWAVRVPAIKDTASQYSKPKFERVWFILGIISSLVLPVAMFQIFINALHLNRADNITQEYDRFMWARLLSFGMFVAVVLLFWGPIAIWKFIGSRRVNKMLLQWSKEDRLLGGGSTTVLDWKVKTPGVFRDRIVLTITLPADRAPTSFHPEAYIPSYINGPTDVGDVYFYPYAKGEPGLPRMSMIGTVYTDEKRAFGHSNV